jgi:hypothetical protein
MILMKGAIWVLGIWSPVSIYSLDSRMAEESKSRTAFDICHSRERGTSLMRMIQLKISDRKNAFSLLPLFSAIFEELQDQDQDPKPGLTENLVVLKVVPVIPHNLVWQAGIAQLHFKT